ncbi:MAG: hypothetical protein NTV73_06325 [Hyphomicrobiales bacterium]|nr:hypothetical protein [Hyphomicrobiales bacterium]
MSIFGFRTRSAERDAATDAGRFDRLSRLLGELTQEISIEKAGLENRYRSAAADAAFLVDAIENDGVSDRSRDRVEELTAAILRCEKRLDLLSRQVSVLSGFRQGLADFVAQSRTGNDPR